MSPRRALVAAVVIAATTAVTAGGAAGATAAQIDLPTTTAEPVPVQPIIPRPNSGEDPESATDPGGWAQYAVLGGIVVALGGLALLIRRDARRSSRRAEEHP